MTDPRSYFSHLFEREIQVALEKANEGYQYTREELSSMTREEINEARRKGRLDDIMLGRK
ncbi:hypothetical protein ACWF94_12480 [Streptomyces sp. NPDC055078]